MGQGAAAGRWSERAAFVGFDWASDHHDVVVVDQRGKIVEDFRFDDTADGWQLLVRRLSKYPDPAVTIETCSGAAVERLLDAGYAVYPVNPKAAKRYRERVTHNRRNVNGKSRQRYVKSAEGAVDENYQEDLAAGRENI
jgi:hypothetical protein